MASSSRSATRHSRLQEERRLMYVGITRAQRTLAVSWTKKRKRPRMVAAQPSRFIAEMALSKTTAREDPRENSRPCAPNSLKAQTQNAGAKQPRHPPESPYFL